MDTLNGKIVKQGYTFDDVLLLPSYSTKVPSQVRLETTLTKKIKLKMPLLSAAMDTVTEEAMATALAQLGGMGVIHKNMPIEDQAKMVERVKSAEVTNPQQAATDNQKRLLCGAAVGVGTNALERVSALVQAGVDIVVIDSAHGHSQGVIDTIKEVRSTYPDLDIMGGNIISAKGAQDLIAAGCTAVKVGIGPGSICTTRVISGVGVPQLTAISDVASVARHYDVGVVGDGGIKQSGDIPKAIACGADVVMIGSMFAGCEETPGQVIEVYGQQVKNYVGMGSLSAMRRGSSDRYFQGGISELDKLVPEGIEATVKYKGAVKDVTYQLLGGLRSGMGYCGCETITELKENAQFTLITTNGLQESHPHDVANIKDAPNYHK